jgi:hypothetical protein
LAGEIKGSSHKQVETGISKVESTGFGSPVYVIVQPSGVAHFCGKKIMRTIALVLGLTAWMSTVFGQLRPTWVDSAVQQTGDAMVANYVFPETAKQARDFLLEQREQGAYKNIRSGEDLALLLTRDLRSVTKDLHVGVSWSADLLPVETPGGEPAAEEMEWLRRMHAENKQGIGSKKILEGNIGYIDITMFGLLRFTADSLIAAMHYVAETDALIIDLRNCRGSMDPAAIPFLSGYFFERPVHLNDFYNRAGNDTSQSWSYGWVPGKTYYGKPVYILTSGRTFSGGEEFAYDYQNLKRAVIVGETTGGGANPGMSRRINDHLEAFIPYGRAINPVTKTNWEGVGVKPDTMVKANRALQKAHELALQRLIAGALTEETRMRLLSSRDRVRANAPVFRNVSFVLPGYTDAQDVVLSGSFNFWDRRLYRMQKSATGWTITVEVEPGEHQYKFIVDGKWILDPSNDKTKKEGKAVNSVIRVDKAIAG